MIQIIKNDFKTRTRKSGYLMLITFIIMTLTLVCLPQRTFGNITTISIDANLFRQMNNASWIIIAFALSYGVVFSITDFFFIKNAEKIDRQGGVNNWMFSTSFSKSRYVLAKFFSNVLLLLSLWLISILVTGIISFLRFPDQVSLFINRLPYFLIFLPGLLLIASLSLFFETFSWLRNTLGNILAALIYLIILPTNLILGLSGHNAFWPLQVLDFSNTSILMRTIIDNVYRVTGSHSSQIMFLANAEYINNHGKKQCH